MDQRSAGCLVSIPHQLFDNINVDFGSDKQIIDTFKQIERSHWDYLDNYRDRNRRRYPTLSIQQYAMKLIQTRNIDHIDTNDIQHYLRTYNRHKKSLPTAGVVLYHRNDGNIYFVVVRMRFSKIWSMPKGKKEPTESLTETARREFNEETGVDLEDLLQNTPYQVIAKTRFYIIESDIKNTQFDGYNEREVDSVKWVSATHVIRNQNYYSKQTIAVAKHLLNDTVIYSNSAPR